MALLEEALTQASGAEALALGVEVAERFVYANPAQAREALTLALTRGGVGEDLETEGVLYRWIGNSYVVQGSLDEAQGAYAEALVRFEAIGYARGISSIRLNSGVVARRRGRVAEAANHYREAILAEGAAGDQKVLQVAHHNLAVIFEQTKLFEEAIEHFELSRQAGLAIGEPTFLGEVNIARMHAYLYEEDAARRYLALAEQSMPDEVGAYRRGEVYLAQGDVLQQFDDHRAALAAYEQAAAMYEQSDAGERLGWALCGVAHNRLQLKQFEGTGEYANRCVELAELPRQQIKAREVQARYLMQTGAPLAAAEVAVENYNEIIDFFTELAEQQVALAIAETEEAFNRQAVQLAQQRTDLAELRTQRQSTLLAGTGVALAIVGGLCVLLFLSVRERNRANGQLQRVASSLEEAVEQRELLLQELNHRVKNNLQVVAGLLGLERRRVEAGAPLPDAMREIQARVLSMASVHEGILDVGEADRVDLADYLKRLAVRLRALYGVGYDIRVDTRCSPTIELASAAPVGLIVCELVTNAVKHAYSWQDKGVVTVTLAREDALAVLTVADEGVGLPATFSLDEPESLGLSLVQDLARQIDTTLSWCPNAPAGTRWSIVLGEQLLSWDDRS